MNNNEIIQKITSELKPVKPLSSPLKRFSKWLLFGVIIISAAIAIMGIRHDLNELLSSPLFIFETILLFFITLSSAIAAFYLAIPGEEKRFNRLLILIPILLWASELVISILVQEDPVVWNLGIKCSSSIFLMGLPIALVLYYMIQRASPTLPRWTGWFALISAFSLSAFAEQFTCHNSQPLHLFIWHFLPVIVLGFGGMFVFRKNENI